MKEIIHFSHVDLRLIFAFLTLRAFFPSPQKGEKRLRRRNGGGGSWQAGLHAKSPLQ